MLSHRRKEEDIIQSSQSIYAQWLRVLFILLIIALVIILQLLEKYFIVSNNQVSLFNYILDIYSVHCIIDTYNYLFIDYIVHVKEEEIKLLVFRRIEYWWFQDND